MKTVIFTFISVFCLATAPFAYKFLGPKWPGLNPQVTYLINEEGTPDAANEYEAVQRGFDVWVQTPGTAIMAQYLGTTNSRAVAPNHQNVLKWEDGNRFDFDKNVIAACYYWYEGTVMKDFDIVFNNRDFAWSTTGEAGKMDVGHIATHEIGHALGLGHTDVTGAVMGPTAAYGDTSHRWLKSDDSLGIVRLYPRTSGNNHLPVITSVPVTEAISGMQYRYQVTATDADGDTLRYRLVTFPLNMRIDSLTGLILWYPKFLDLGPHAVSVEVRDSYGGIARQTYTINVGDLVVYTTDTTIGFGDTLYYNVYVTNMEGWGIFAGNIEVGYNSSLVTVLGIDTAGSVISGTTYAKNITTQMIKIAFAASGAYNGAGPLFRIKMLVNKEHCGENIALNISTAFFNDGTPVATKRNGVIFMECGTCGGGGTYSYNIDGKVVYEANRMGVGDVDLTIRDLNRSVKTNNDGFFEFVQVPRSSNAYHMSVKKDSGDVRNGISAFDASQILRYVVGLFCMNTFTHQAVCADVNANRMITAYDAALILRYLVKIDDGTRIGKWVVVPDTLTLANLLEPRHGLEFRAYMIGDVSGNWNDFDSNMPKVEAGSQTNVVMTNSSDSITVSYQNIPDAYSGEFEIRFDTLKYGITGIQTLSGLQSFTCATNVLGGTVLVAFAGTQPMASSGDLFTIVLEPKTEENASAPAELTFARFNEMPSEMIRIEYRTTGSPETMAQGISRIYPNPFNPMVSIEYAMERAGKARLAVYDVAGRVVCELVKGKIEKGVYKKNWNATDNKGVKMGSGIYLLRFETKGVEKVSKLHLIR